MPDDLWWGYSKKYGWVVLDRTKRQNKPGTPTPLKFVRCFDWREYSEERQNWEQPNYIFADLYIKTLPPDKAVQAARELASLKRDYSSGRSTLTLDRAARRFEKLRLNGKMPIGLATRLIEMSAYWHGHPSGSPVSAPSHFKRVQSGRKGWEIEFGANKFLIEVAFDDCEKVVMESIAAQEGRRFDRKKLLEDMRWAVRGQGNRIKNL